MQKFVLFDVDGTLIDSRGAGRRALERAMKEITGIARGFMEIDLAGKTDLQIMREGLKRSGFLSCDGLIHSMVERYLFFLQEEVKAANGHLKKGVRDLLKRLSSIDGIYLGLLTGNLEEGARIKLEPYGINQFFPIGAFGSDNEDRNHLLPIARERLFEFAGVSLPFKYCIVVGDTPRDVVCAKIHGSISIAVATGPYSVRVLESTGADLVLHDLSDTDRITRWIEDVKE